MANIPAKHAIVSLKARNMRTFSSPTKNSINRTMPPEK
jgi:hypothetical protein